MKTKLLLMMTLLMLGLLPGRAQSTEVTVGDLVFRIENGEAALIDGPCNFDPVTEEQLNNTPVSRIEIPEKVYGCDVTTINFGPYCETLVIPKTVKTIQITKAMGPDEVWGADFIDSKVESPGKTFDIYGLYTCYPGQIDWGNGMGRWLKVPPGCEGNYPQFSSFEEYSDPFMIYSDETEKDGVVYRVNHHDNTAIIAGYTDGFTTGAGVTYTVPVSFVDNSGKSFGVVGIDKAPNVETLVLPANDHLRFLRVRGNGFPALKNLIVPKGLQGLYYGDTNNRLEKFIFEDIFNTGTYCDVMYVKDAYYYGDIVPGWMISGTNFYYQPGLASAEDFSDFVASNSFSTYSPLPADHATIDTWLNPGLKFRIGDYNGPEADVVGQQAFVTGYDDNLPEDVKIPETWGLYTVLGIDADAFKGCTTIKSVTLPITVQEIGKNAFMNCTGLESVYYTGSSHNLHVVGEGAFEGCTSLKEFRSKDTYFPILEIMDRAFYGTTALTDLDGCITKIGSSAFYNSSIKSLTIGNVYVKGIYVVNDLTVGDQAFYMSKIERFSVCLENEENDEPSLTLGEEAFYNSSIKEFDYQGSNLTIGKSAFQGCNAMKKFSISDPILEIGDYAFMACTSLETLNLCPKYEWHNGTRMGTQLFGYCTNLKTLILPYLAFVFKENTLGHWIQSLEQLTMPWFMNSSPIVPNNAFVGYGMPTNLKIVSFNPAPFNDGAFDNDTYQNATVKVPKGQINTYKNTQGWRNFANFAEISDDDYNKVIINDVEYSLNQSDHTATVTGYTQEMVGIYVDFIPVYQQMPIYDEHGWIIGYETVQTGFIQQETPIYNIHESITLESSINWNNATYTVKKIANEALKDCQMLKKLTIPASYTDVGTNAFTGSSLEEVVINSTFGNTYTSNNNPFYGCEKLVKATLGEGIKKIPNALFNKASALKEVTLPGGLTVIGNNAFKETALENIQLPSSVTSIGYEAFMDTPLKSIILHEGIKGIGSSCFSGTLIEELDFPSTFDTGEEEINEIFQGMKHLRKVDMQKTLYDTMYRTFEGRTSIEEIILPAKLENIGELTFASCTSLKEVVFPSTLEIIGPSAFDGCTSLKKIELPEGLVQIYEYAFNNCSSLEDVNLPSTLKEIDVEAFYGTKLRSLKLPECLQYIFGYAFQGNLNQQDGGYCQGFDYVVTYATTPPSRSTFLVKGDNQHTVPPLYVPVGCKSVYEAAWGDEFTDIREFPGEEFFVSGEEKTSARGATVKVPVELFNLDEAAGVMFDVTLPAGVELAQNSSGKYNVVLGDRTTDHQLIVNKLSDGEYRFIILSLTSQPISGYEGELLTMALSVSSKAAAGDHELLFHNTQVVAESGSTVSSFLPSDGTSPFTILPDVVGDLNGNTQIDLLDVIELLRHINKIQLISPLNMAIVDVVSDGVIDLLDALQLLDILSKQPASSNGAAFDGECSLSLTPASGGIDVALDATPCTALSFDVTLPEGITLDGVTLDASRCGGHSARLSDLGGGRYRVQVWSATSSDITGSSGRLMRLETSVTPTTVSADAIEVGTNDLRLLTLAPVNGYATGIRLSSAGLSVSTEDGTLVVSSDSNATITVVGTDGRLVRRLQVPRGISRHQGFAPGVYLVNGERVIIK